MADARQAWITGIGLVSSLGEGIDAHWQALNAGVPNVDTAGFAPWIVHPLAPVNFDSQIPKKGDQRQMELWQRIGTYAAGLALDSAGVKGNADILSRMDMIVAAGGGERDLAVDSAILTADLQGQTSEDVINERLMSDLRPTLFLAQLSNLLAGNISIVHGVIGSSRTFMGEEAAGIDALRIALARIAAGQSDIALVGAAQNAQRKEMLMLFEFGGYNLKNEYAPVWSRGSPGGFALGSAGAFLVIESRAHAEARGARPFARLSAILSDHASRKKGAVEATLGEFWQTLDVPAAGTAIISGASGAEPATSEERAFLAAHADVPARTVGTLFGQTLEAQFPLAVAVAAMCLSRGALFNVTDKSGIEAPTTARPERIAVTGVGHWRGEGMGLLEAVEGGRTA
jgi:3-oxoacyl-[acyl-carrier-protein] synthase II